MKIRTRTNDLSFINDLIEAIGTYLDVTVSIDDTNCNEAEQLLFRLHVMDELIAQLMQAHDEAENAAEALLERVEELADDLGDIELRLAEMAMARMDGEMVHAHKVAKTKLMPYVDHVHSGGSYHNVPVDDLEDAISAAIEAWVNAKLNAQP